MLRGIVIAVPSKNYLTETGLLTPLRIAGGEHPRAKVAERPFEIVVVFTGPAGTLTALKAAGAMALGLNTRIRLIVPQAIPYVYALNRAPIAAGFTEQSLAGLVADAANRPAETAIEIYLCRDRLRTVMKVLQPNSLVVIGGKKRIWPTRESRLAKKLRSVGHEVLFAPVP